MKTRRAIPVLLLSWSVLLSCRTPPEPVPPFVGPAVELAVREYEGPLLGDGAVPESRSAVGDPADEDGAAFEPVVARVLALESFPADVFSPASGLARLVSPLAGRDLLLSTGHRTRGVRVASSVGEVEEFAESIDDGDLGRVAALGELRGVITRGSTVAFRVESEHLRPVPGRPDGIPEVVLASLSRRADGTLESGLIVEGVREEGDSGPVARSEVALFPVVEGEEGSAFAFVVPSPFAGGGAAVVFIVRVTTTASEEDRDEHDAAVARARERFESARSPAPPPPSPLPLWPGAHEALTGLEQPDQQRSALAYLAGNAGAPVAEDVALTGADGLVDQVARSVVAELETAGPPVVGESLAWLIERSAYEGLARDASAGEAVAEAVLIRHAGELGRYPDVLVLAVRRATDREELGRRLVEENRAYLTDLDPAARVRAFDWFVARGEAPEGFDPLGSREDRRAAFARAYLTPDADDE